MNTWVLLYHAIDSQETPFSGSRADTSVVVDANAFARQLARIGKLSKKVVSLDAALANPDSDIEQVVITFDDGHSSNWFWALPLLRQFGATATFYVISGKINVDRDYLTEDQIRELHKSGMTIGSHTVTHRFLPTLSETEIRRELTESKDRLEQILGIGVDHLALPGGHFDRRTFTIARACGYKSLATCEIGVLGRDLDPMRIPRLEIRRGMSETDFELVFTNSTMRKMRMIEGGKACLRKVFGLSNYSRLRTLAHRMIDLSR